MTKKKFDQLRFNFEDFEEDSQDVNSDYETSNQSNSGRIDYSFQERLSKKQKSDNEEIYKEIRILIKHLY